MTELEKLLNESERFLTRMTGQRIICITCSELENEIPVLHSDMLNIAMIAVSLHTGVNIELILSRSRVREIMTARHIVVYLLFTILRDHKQVARIINFERTTIYNSILFVESQNEVDKRFYKLFCRIRDEFDKKSKNQPHTSTELDDLSVDGRIIPPKKRYA